MGSLFEQIFSLLSTQAGSLTYHLVLAFSIVGALQITVNQNQRDPSPRNKRALVGLSILLFLQVALFICSGLVWQQIIKGSSWLPPLDRAVTLLSLVTVIWLWVFPDPSPSGDTGTLILGLLVISAIIFGALWQAQHDPEVALNGSWLDIAAQAASLTILSAGILLLIIRKPDGFGYGISMLVLLGAGAILHWIMLPYGGDYPAAVRLGQMAAFPFLILLPLRSGSTVLGTSQAELEKLASQSKSGPANGKARYYADPQVWQSLLKLTNETQPDRICNEITSMVARIMQADLCLLLSPIDENGKVNSLSGYDLAHNMYVNKLTLDNRAIPMLTSSMRMGRMRRFSVNSTSPDLTNLMDVLKLERIGNLLLLPVQSPDGKPISSIVLLSPYSSKDWSGEEQSFLTVLARLLVYFLQRSQEITGLKEDITQVQQMSLFAQNQLSQVMEESQKLRGHMAVMQENSTRDQAQLANLTAMVAAQVAVQDVIEQLQAENEKLNEAAAKISEETTSQENVPAGAPGGELRLALEEIAFLSSALSETEMKISATRLTQPTVAPLTSQIDIVLSIAQDLRQPLSSIVGYTDFLLSEAIGILGAMQRKYIERIKVSTERMSRLIDDLVQSSSAESNPAQLQLEEVDICALVNQALLDSKTGLQGKQISLQVQLPEEPLSIHTSPSAIRKVVDQLLSNAENVTPNGGNIAVSAHLERSETDQDYVLLRIADGGEGIAPQDLSRVFSPREAGTSIQGTSENGTELSSVKTLVEMLGGRAWVDSDPGHGAMFSVLLPVSFAREDLGAGEMG